jgi:hypothetical protein
MIKFGFAVLTIAMICGSCSKENVFGDGPVVSEVRPVNNFTGLSMAIPGEVNFSIGPIFRVEIKAQQNVIDVIRTNVVNGVLDIDVKYDVRLRSHENIIIDVQAPSSDYFRLSGSGDINAIGDLTVNQLRMELTGSGNIYLQKAIVAGKIDARISGSGNIRVQGGSAYNEELRISGSGNLDLQEVVAQRADAYISGSGDIRVNLSERLQAHISGSGSVYYKGNPSVSAEISGSGKVKPI